MKNTNSKERPDLANTQAINQIKSGQPKIGMISLGCPKALVDSERILNRLRTEGYSISSEYNDAEAVIVNTCGFLDSAKAESLEAISEALKENGKVIVTGCLGANPDYITGAHPSVLAVTGPQQYEKVLDAVHQNVPVKPNPYIDLLPTSSISLTPRHYSYLKISEGCNHKCKFCIIPSMRGKLASRPAHAILREAEKLVDNGVKELLIISQDTSAYGLDLKYSETNGHRAHIVDLARDLGSLGVWVRLHYVYPYPHVKNLIPFMSNGTILPYLDIPFQHSHPDVLKRMSRPAASSKTLEQIENWRKQCSEITIRSTFIVGYPGETESEFQHLLNWLKEAKLDRVGCFKYENVNGARSNNLPNQISDDIKEDRWQKFMQVSQEISETKLEKKVGTKLDVIVDSVEADGATCRTKADAPEIDGNLFIDKNFKNLSVGNIVNVTVDGSSEYDLWGKINNS
ncbi:MAG: 30S ribosomal protein S12 methylthiotransferase RimO [Paracoccaceae bacterium]|nr:MAG: 30S ribosomal protein S12 methylthiotransferase RimO [Paracoccaceae bacterium]|tara:strand:- start:1788 stop:3161 length:1374 start_codon:yes stop_codon:yes gene_type:complete